MLYVALSFPLMTVSFSSLTIDWSSTNLLSLCQSAADVTTRITAAIKTMEAASAIACQPLTNTPQRPAKRAVAAMTSQMMFLASCFTDSIMPGTCGSGFAFAPNLQKQVELKIETGNLTYVFVLRQRSLASPMIPVYIVKIEMIDKFQNNQLIFLILKLTCHRFPIKNSQSHKF